MGIILFILGIAVSAGGTYFFLNPKNEYSSEDPKQTIEEAKMASENLRKENQESILRIKRAMEAEEKTMEESFSKMEETLAQKEEILKRREERNKSQEEIVKKQNEEIKTLKEEVARIAIETAKNLSHQSGLSREQALEKAKENLKELITKNADARKNAELEEFQEESARHAKSILQVVLHRLAVPTSIDKNSTAVTIKDDKFKGMLVGKNGINVEYFESLLPVSLIFNFGDPETLHVGGINLLRRNMAKRAIDKLQLRAKKSGNLTQEMIKTAIEEGEAEILAICDKKGEETLKSLGLDPKKIPAELTNDLGRLYFRTSYGQNVSNHSIEMAFASRMIAELIGADPRVAMEAALFHDLGKAIDHDIGGAHDDISKDLLEKYNFDPKIVHAAFAHHDKVPCESPEDFIVKAADAISGSRPGARQESVTNYFERIQELEQAVMSFSGVSKVYAMSAGREMRAIVDGARVRDGDMDEMAKQMAGKITEEIAFPGKIKVNIIRITKSVDYAREKQLTHK